MHWLQSRRLHGRRSGDVSREEETAAEVRGLANRYSLLLWPSR